MSDTDDNEPTPVEQTADPPSEEPPEATAGTDLDPAERRLEWIAVVLLAITALATAWSGYQASLWDGNQSSNYTQASGARTNAAQQLTEANQHRIADLTAFENYIDAFIDGDEEVASFYEQRFSDGFTVAFEAWLALDPLNNTDAPSTPLAMPEYQLEQDVRAAELTARADELFAQGEDDNSISDVYTLTTLLFAVVLFFAAISERFEFRPARITLLVMAAIGFVAGLIVAMGQPITLGG